MHGLSRQILRFLHRSRRTILLIVVVATITIILNVLLSIWLTRSHNLTVPSIGTIYVTGVEAYGGDLKVLNGEISIDWGTLKLGDSKRIFFFLRSTSSVPIRLSLNATDWRPEGLGSYMTLSWDYNGTQLAPKEEISVSLTLSVSNTTNFADYLISNSVNSYNFTLYIFAQK